MANEAELADHSRTTWDFAQAFDPTERAIEIYGRHVVEFVGMDKPWSNLGRVAIQHFKLTDTCIYFIGGDDGPVKIGLTNAPLERLACFQIGSPVLLKIHALAPGGLRAERDYQARFAEHRLHGEWFARHPALVAEIERLAG